jgi:diguanylate cyclase (GGDEF)-like protein
MTNLLSDSDQHDPLTGALASGAFNALAENAFRTARNARGHCSLLILTLDHFDRLAAAGGREAADAALVETAALLEAHTSARSASVARIDASTFAILLPNLDRAQATRIAADLRSALETQSASWNLPNLRPAPITASLGAASLSPTDSPTFARTHQLIIAARRAAEAATLCGGNTVRAFQPKLAA